MVSLLPTKTLTRAGDTRLGQSGVPSLFESGELLAQLKTMMQRHWLWRWCKCVCVRVSCYNKQVVTGQLFIREMQGALGEDLGSRTWKRTCKLGVPGHECAAGSLYKSVDDAVVSSYHRGPHPRRFNFEPHQSGFNLRTSQNCDPSFAILLVSFMR